MEYLEEEQSPNKDRLKIQHIFTSLQRRGSIKDLFAFIFWIVS